MVQIYFWFIFYLLFLGMVMYENNTVVMLAMQKSKLVSLPLNQTYLVFG